MSSDTASFADLAESNEQLERWLGQQAEATRLVDAWGAPSLFESIARTLEVAWEQDGALPDHDELQQLVQTLLGDLGVPTQHTTERAGRDVTTVIVSGGLAQFLVRAEPSMEKLAGVAKVEFYLDIAFVAKQIAATGASAAWLDVLRKLKLDLQTINDDEYQASDELERWRKELPRQLPSWHEGNFPRMWGSLEQLVSGLLRFLDEDAWLKFLDQLPIPALVESMLWDAHVERAPEAILEWIRRAPLAFDENGVRTTSALIFVLERRAFGLVEGQASRRIGRAADDVEVEHAVRQVDGALEELAAAILARADGRVLLAELSASYMVRAQTSPAESQRTKLRQALHRALGLSYARAVGDAAEFLEFARGRAAVGPARSEWGLWLASVALASEQRAHIGEVSRQALGRGWPWLVELLVARDPGIAERHSPTPQWTEALAGMALCASDEPLRSLETAWRALGPQRMEPGENRYAKDPWATSRFLTRVGFMGVREVQSRDLSGALWSAAQEMALSAWLSQSNPDPFAEVAYGMARLAAGNVEIAGEPTRTLEYLVGEVEVFTDVVLALLSNGCEPARLLAGASAAGIDAIAYVGLDRKPGREALTEEAIARLTSARRSDVDGAEGV